jgi:hypothetical protein
VRRDAKTGCKKFKKRFSDVFGFCGEVRFTSDTPYLGATFTLRLCAPFGFIPSMQISGQDSLLPKIDLENPSPINTSEMRKFYTAICAGKWTLAAKGQPDWASKALGEFCRCCNDGLREKSLGYRGLKFDSPKLLALCSELEVIRTNSAIQALLTFKNKRAFDKFETFFCGKLTPLDLRVPDSAEEFGVPHTARAYLIFFIAWRELAELKTVRAIYNWLIRMKAIRADTHDKKDPNKDTDHSRNTHTLLKRIGFPLTDKGGAPKKKNPTTAPLKRPT